MSQHFMTVCVFCLICATHTPCSAHTEIVDQKILKHYNNGLADPNRINIPDRIKSSDHGTVLSKNNMDSPNSIDNDVWIKRPNSFKNVLSDEQITSNSNNNKTNITTNTFVKSDEQLIRHKRVKKSTELLDEHYYVRRIFHIFNQTGDLIHLDDFKNLIKRLHLYNMFHQNSDSNNKTCVKGESILATLTYQDFDENLNKTDLSIENFRQVCPLLVYQLAADTSEERNGCVLEPEAADAKTITRHHTESSTKNDYGSAVPAIWLYATISVIIISACGLLGVIIIPFMQKHFYHQLLQFLVALAIGTLCGDALLHLLPHAMLPHHHHPTYHPHPHSSSYRYSSSDSASSSAIPPLSAASTSQTFQHNQNMWKGFVAMLGIIFFYFVEKFLTLGAEWRKRRQKKHKLPARVRVMRDNDSSIGQNSVGEKLCKHKYSSYPYCYDEIATETQDDHHNRGNNVAHKSGGSSNTTHNESSGHNDTKITTLGEYEELDVNNFQQKPHLNNHNNKTIETNQNELLSSDLPMLEIPNNTVGDLPSHGGHVLPVSEEESYTVILRAHESKHHGHSHAHGHVHSAPDSLSSVAWMVIMGDGLHNFTDGMAIGAAFASGIAGGFSTSVAVFCHELPHEIGDFAVLLKAGMSAKQAIFYNLLSSVLCFFGCLLGVAIGHSDTASEWVFAAAAGMFIYIALVDMIPELTSSHSKEGGSLLQCLLQFLGLMTGLGVMTLIALYENDIKGMFGED